LLLFLLLCYEINTLIHQIFAKTVHQNKNLPIHHSLVYFQHFSQEQQDVVQQEEEDQQQEGQQVEDHQTFYSFTQMIVQDYKLDLLQF